MSIQPGEIHVSPGSSTVRSIAATKPSSTTTRTAPPSSEERARSDRPPIAVETEGFIVSMPFVTTDALTLEAGEGDSLDDPATENEEGNERRKHRHDCTRGHHAVVHRGAVGE